MVNITKCKGNGCVLKNDCYCYTAKESETQSWFVNEPFTYDGVFECEMFMYKSLYDQLIDIVKGK